MVHELGMYRLCIQITNLVLAFWKVFFGMILFAQFFEWYVEDVRALFSKLIT